MPNAKSSYNFEPEPVYMPRIDENPLVERGAPLPLAQIQQFFDKAAAPDAKISSASPVDTQIFAETETLGASQDYRESHDLSEQHTALQEFHFINIIERFMNAMIKYSGILVDELSRVEGELDSCLTDLLEKLKESAKRASESTFWTFLQRIATFLSTAFTLLLGGTVIAASHAVIGGLLLTSGFLSLANFLLVEFHGWEKISYSLMGSDEKKRQQFLSYVPSAVGLTAAVLALSGGVQASFAGVAIPKPLAVIEGTFLLFQGTTSFGAGMSQSDQIEAKARVQAVKADQTWLENTQESTTTVLENLGTERKTALWEQFIRTWSKACEAVHQNY